MPVHDTKRKIFELQDETSPPLDEFAAQHGVNRLHDVPSTSKPVQGASPKSPKLLRSVTRATVRANKQVSKAPSNGRATDNAAIERGGDLSDMLTFSIKRAPLSK